MRWIGVLLMLGCGGSGATYCATDGVHTFTATRQSAEAGCESEPLSFEVTINPLHSPWMITEGATAHTIEAANLTNAGGCNASATWYSSDGSLWHAYLLHPSDNYVDVVRRNACSAHYTLTPH